MIAPVAERIKVMRSVVAVIVAIAVALSKNQLKNLPRGGIRTYRCINQCDTGPKVGIRLDLVYESVLAPIAGHQRNAHQSKRNQEDRDGSAGVNKLVHAVKEDVVCNLTASSLERKTGLVVAHEIARQVEPNKQVKAANIVQEVQNAVALVSHCRGQIVGSIAFDVVVLDVMEEIGVPGVSHQRVKDVWEDSIDKGVFLVQDTSHVNVLVHEQGVGAHVVELHG